MSTDNKKARTPRPHPYVMTVDGRQVLIEAHSEPSARKWFNDNKVEIREATPREVHMAGVAGTAFYDATGATVDDEAPAGGDLLPFTPLHDPAAAVPGAPSLIHGAEG